jgi:hypothetical protein
LIIVFNPASKLLSCRLDTTSDEMTSPEFLDGDGDAGHLFANSSNDTFNSSLGPDPQVNPMGLAGIVATSIILGVMTLTTIVGKSTIHFF